MDTFISVHWEMSFVLEKNNIEEGENLVQGSINLISKACGWIHFQGQMGNIKRDHD